MSSKLVLSAQGLSKTYYVYPNPRARLVHMLTGRLGRARAFEALKDVNLEMHRGESLGVVGRNGAGKSTFLQLLCGTVTPTQGDLKVLGRVAPILELGAGFNPDFTGRENIYMNAAILGLERHEIKDRLAEIIDFADIGDYIDQPVRYYSSGMYVRLAFAIATSIDPDILVIDEAISVGDGQFAKKSFDRIQQLRKQGVTLLFCSHAMYQVEALCDRALWLHQGQVQSLGPSAHTISLYNDWLAAGSDRAHWPNQGSNQMVLPPSSTSTRLDRIDVRCHDQEGRHLTIESGQSDVDITIRHFSDPSTPIPSLLVIVHGAGGMDISSTGTVMDQIMLSRDEQGYGIASLRYQRLPLLKGQYYISVYLMCEEGIHVYEAQERYAQLDICQNNLELGVVSLPHEWRDLTHES